MKLIIRIAIGLLLWNSSSFAALTTEEICSKKSIRQGCVAETGIRCGVEVREGETYSHHEVFPKNVKRGQELCRRGVYIEGSIHTFCKCPWSKRSK